MNSRNKIATKLSIVDYLPVLIMQSWLTKTLFGTTIVWKGTKQGWVSNTFKQPTTLVTFALVTIYIIYACVQFISIVSKHGWLNYIPSSLLLTIEVASYLLGVAVFKHSKQIATLLNSLVIAEMKTQSMIEVEANEVKEGVRKTDKAAHVIEAKHKSMLQLTTAKAFLKDVHRGEMGRFVPYLGYLSQYAVGGIVFGFLLHSPCSLPIFIRASVRDCAATRPTFIQLPDNLMVKLTAVFIDTFIITYTMTQGTFAIATAFSNGAICIADRLIRVRENLNRIGLANRPLREDQLINVVNEYKTVKVFEAMYNSINSGGIVPIILLDMFILATLSLYTCVALHSQIALPMLAMSAMVGFDTMILAQIIMYSVAGKVSSISSKFTSTCKRDSRFKCSKYLRRVTKSIAPLKVKIGASGNYMEKMTPLNITQMTVDQATSLILVTKK